MRTSIKQLRLAYKKLEEAIANGSSKAYCLKLWSNFIRLRDGQRCVICHSRYDLNAHHIVRKSLMPQAKLQTGNGITLCAICHKEPHKNFNRKPNLNLPMDDEGGEKIDLLTSFFGALITDAKKRNLLNDEFYYLSDEVLGHFKAFRSISRDLPFLGSRLEQAYLIWRQTPRRTLNALLRANGFDLDLPDNFIQLGSVTIISKKTTKR